MINRLIQGSLHHRFLVISGFLALCAWGLVAINRVPIDAIPDLSENQVIVYADWPGRSPQEVEDQITYPLSVACRASPASRRCAPVPCSASPFSPSSSRTRSMSTSPAPGSWNA
jgi:Cu/Ag efflux pump CusA